MAELDAGGLQQVLEEAYALATAGKPSVVEVPPGAGKSLAAHQLLVDRGAGVLALPTHALAQEAERSIAALGGKSRHLEGTMRVLERERPDVAAQIKPYVDRGWPVDYLVDALGLRSPAPDTADGGLLVLMHEHLREPLLPPIHRQRGPVIRGPVLVDEAPPWVWDHEVTVEELRELAAPLHSTLRTWGKKTGLTPLASLFLEVAAEVEAERRSKDKGDPFALHLRGPDLAQRVLGAAGGDTKFLALAQRAYGWGPGGAIEYRVRAPDPMPPEVVARGRPWVRRDIDWVTGLLVEEVLSAQAGAARRGGAALRVHGSAKRAVATYRVGVPWSARLPAGLTPIFLDASAALNWPLYERCYPGVRRVVVEVADARGPTRLHVEHRGVSRRRLLAPSASAAGRVLSDRAPAVLRRVVADAAELVAMHLGIRRSVLFVVPKAVREVLDVAVRVAAGADGAEDEQVVCREGLDELVAHVRRLVEDGVICELHTTHYGGERGSNEFAGVDAVVTVQNTPNLGEVGDTEHILGVEVTRPTEQGWILGPAARAAEHGSYLQAHGRDRALRAPGARLRVHVGVSEPLEWRWGTAPVCPPATGGGPVPSPARAVLGAVVGAVYRRLGGVCGRMVCWLATRPEVVSRLFPGDQDMMPMLARHSEEISKLTMDKLKAMLRGAGWSGGWYAVTSPTKSSWVVFAATQEAADAAVWGLECA